MPAAPVLAPAPTRSAAIRASVLPVPPTIEEAARGLGRTGPDVLLGVTATLVRPGVVAGLLIVLSGIPLAFLLARRDDTGLLT